MSNPNPTRCHRLLQWAAEDLSDPIIAADPDRLALERQTVIDRLSPHIEEVVQLAWAQVQQLGQSSGHDLVRSQSPQALGVGRPVIGRSGGHAPIAVKIYALGRGVSIEGQRRNLLSSERDFEIEAYGKFFVFEPSRAISSHGLVAPVEGDVAAIALSPEAVDKEHLTEFDSVDGHFSDLPKTTILTLPQGHGKSTISEELAHMLGCTEVVEEWSWEKPLTPNALHLTNAADTEGFTQ